ncbi:MAG: Ribosomal small subunit methyltransferase [Hydrocarboniphaga sp.]|uniref:16S rRNA (adenine(1518)-N(6)/adenine(1519)-N(6))- dimethyltransferase RsmA n=1 Tax=Hydrocarboniphaga sp. TaxID=2033016 RepID=UPI0026244066|nr:16S rRNA (adenine(1518)-N(6)/adenine(1519)-N(6))-dimethyltransferase RsmA [Hydrocarboniphaga sp.]MDB5972409.1 Ribosomal small subunit methyltransferase [Hydrocarboniphaga sp.]
MSEPRAKKHFGQHFLHDPYVIDRILRTVNPQPGEAIIEIGPGPGALTAPLLKRVPQLTVVELDRDVIPHLREACGNAPGLNIVMADALKVDYAALAPPDQPLRLVGNLPYNISTPLLFHLLGFADRVQDMHFMLQKEVVDRMCAGADDDAYGRLSVALAARAEVVHLFDVGAGAFRPPPKVESAVVRLRPRKPDFVIDDWKTFDRVVGAAFLMRRKTLTNSLRQLLSADQIRAAGIDPQWRAERVSAAQFAALANQLSV